MDVFCSLRSIRKADSCSISRRDTLKLAKRSSQRYRGKCWKRARGNLCLNASLASIDGNHLPVTPLTFALHFPAGLARITPTERSIAELFAQYGSPQKKYAGTEQGIVAPLSSAAWRIIWQAKAHHLMS